METIHFTISQAIRKPVAEVFHAVADPIILSSYFTRASSGPLEIGAKVTWKWDGDFEEYFFVTNVILNEKIEGHWEAWKVDYHVNTKFEFTAKDDNSTTVRITEEGFHNDEIGHESAFGQCNGWTHMLMCLKAWLEHDIDLR